HWAWSHRHPPSLVLCPSATPQSLWDRDLDSVLTGGLRPGRRIRRGNRIGIRPGSRSLGAPLVPRGHLLGAGYFGGGVPTTFSLAWASNRCPAGEGGMLEVPSGRLISCHAALGGPPN